MTTATRNRFETGIGASNLKHWGMLEAVKEFVQNAVYAKTILGNEISIQHDGKYALIGNTPSGFSKGKLIIGESEQSDVAGAPGQYGEGMKMAMLVGRRAGKEVQVVTNGFVVFPEIEPSSLDSSVDSLVFYIEDTPEWNGGTMFKIECDKEILDKAVSFFGVLNGVDEVDTKQNTILETVQDSLYVNGVKVADINSIFSYNFTSADLMNRDRTTVDMEKVKKEIRGMISRIDDTGLAGVVVQCILENQDYLESQAGVNGYSTDLDMWKVAVNMTMGPKIALATGSESDTKARYHKFKVYANVPQAWREFLNYHLDIPYTNQLEEVAEKPKNIHRKPSADESAILGWAKRLIKLYYADYGDVRVSETVTDAYGNNCLGTYDHGTGITWLRKDILSSKELTFKVLLHETVHRVTGASDNTEAFTRGWEDASYRILMRGKLD